MGRSTVSGGAQLRRDLEAAGERAVDAARDVVREEAEALRHDWRSRVPVDTGDYRDAIEVDVAADGLSADIGVTDPRIDYPRYLERGTSSMPPQPSARPAAEAERRRLPRAAAKRIGKALR